VISDSSRLRQSFRLRFRLRCRYDGQVRYAGQVGGQDRFDKLTTGWVCLGLFFLAFAKSSIFIILYCNIAYIHLSIQQIGFVLHNSSILIEPYFVMRISYCAVLPEAEDSNKYEILISRILNNLKIQMTQIQNKLNINERLFLTWIC